MVNCKNRAGYFITDDGYLISNYHVVKDAAKIRLLTSAGLIDAKVVQVDAAIDLALLKANGRFAPLPIVPVAQGFWAARWQRSVFPTSVFAGVRARKSDR
jgi:serine protease Do